MGFGPRARDRDAARAAIRDLLTLLYPERATDSALRVIDRLATLLLDNGAPLSFRSMARVLADAAWRASLLARSPDSRPFFEPYTGLVIAPRDLDPDFAWLLSDRLEASEPDGPP